MYNNVLNNKNIYLYCSKVRLFPQRWRYPCCGSNFILKQNYVKNYNKIKGMITLICENNNETIQVEEDLCLSDIKEKFSFSPKYEILGALVNNKLKELSYKVYNPKTIRFIDITHPLGARMYALSLSFLLYKAVNDIYPGADLKIEHSTTHGLYCRIKYLSDDKEKVIVALKKRMKELVDQNLVFRSEIMSTKDAIKLLSAKDQKEKNKDTIDLLKSSNQLYTKVNFLGDDHKTPGIFFGKFLFSTGYLQLFDLKSLKNDDGFLLQSPKPENPLALPKNGTTLSKLFNIYREHKNWLNVLDIPYISNLNETLNLGHSNQIIQISEALHEKKIIEIVNNINADKDNIKIVLISGPSSSGKTTTCRRLAIQLAVLGYTPQQLSLDNYFVNRKDTPLDANGEYDFEALEALDIELFNSDLSDLLAGKEVRIPKFDFKTGKRFYDKEVLKMKPNSILVIEGIHGLNPKLTKKIDDSVKYKIFVSPITQISIDRHNIIHSTDSRLIRRIVRDFNFRGYSAYETLKRWDSVTDGEKKHIFPYQENADVMFNSSLMYELCVLKKYAEPLLRSVPANVPEYATASRLLGFLSIFNFVSELEIPPTSIMREFLGGSSFIY